MWYLQAFIWAISHDSTPILPWDSWGSLHACTRHRPKSWDHRKSWILWTLVTIPVCSPHGYIKLTYKPNLCVTKVHVIFGVHCTRVHASQGLIYTQIPEFPESNKVICLLRVNYSLESQLNRFQKPQNFSFFSIRPFMVPGSHMCPKWNCQFWVVFWA